MATKPPFDWTAFWIGVPIALFIIAFQFVLAAMLWPLT